MKKILSALGLFLSVIGASYTHAQALYDIRVVDARNFKEPPSNLNNPENAATHYADIARHKHHEVNVYHYPAYYKVNYFQQENDSIKAHGFMITEPSVFYDKAEYSWAHDTLSIHLINPTSKSKIFRGYGKGSTNSLITD